MRLSILALILAGLAIATGAEARDTWFGPQLAFPVPARNVGDDQLGIDAGFTITDMNEPHFGVGVDLAYHYWPASREYKAAFDRYLRNTRYEVIDGSTWAFSAIQATAHVKLVATTGRYSPWVQLGGGAYRLNRNLAGTNWTDSPVIYVGGKGNISFVPGWYASAGVSFRTRSGMALGLDASLHHPWAEKRVPEFYAFTVGTHVLFGR